MSAFMVGSMTGDPNRAGRPAEVLIDAVPDIALVALAPDGRIVSWNSGAARIHGWAESEILALLRQLPLPGQTWSRSRRVVAKVAWHPGELYPRVGFRVTNLCRPPERVVAFYNQRGIAEQWIREGKNAVKWTRLSCRSMTANVVRLQLHALAYNMANFFRILVLPDGVERWSLTTLREKLVKIGTKVIAHARYTVFQPTFAR